MFANVAIIIPLEIKEKHRIGLNSKNIADFVINELIIKKLGNSKYFFAGP
jgi:hypothetical protein